MKLGTDQIAHDYVFEKDKEIEMRTFWVHYWIAGGIKKNIEQCLWRWLSSCNKGILYGLGLILIVQKQRRVKELHQCLNICGKQILYLHAESSFLVFCQMVDFWGIFMKVRSKKYVKDF